MIWIDFILHIVVTAQNYENESFDFYYNLVYTIIVAVFGTGALLAAVFVFGPEGHTFRQFVAYALLVCSITSILIATWIIVYFNAFYKYDEVYLVDNHKQIAEKDLDFQI